MQIFDSYGEVLQTQADAAGGGTMVNDGGFDAHGWVTSANNHYYIGEAEAAGVCRERCHEPVQGITHGRCGVATVRGVALE